MLYIYHTGLIDSMLIDLTLPYISSCFLERNKVLYITPKSYSPFSFPFSLPLVTTILKLECVIPCWFLYLYYMLAFHCLNLHFSISNKFEHLFRYLLTI